MSFTIYSDGSGTTGGPAGIGFIVLSDGRPYKVESVPVADATNQQAELLAATHALDSLPEGQDVVLYSDSRYVVKGFTKVDGDGEYLPKWRSRDWREIRRWPDRQPWPLAAPHRRCRTASRRPVRVDSACGEQAG